jgi:hypothetical protein
MTVEPGAVRASDADREKVVAVLNEAVGAGTLTLAEAEERITTAYAARYRSDLAGLTADLPTEPAQPAAPARRRPPVLVFPLVAVVLIGLWAVSHAPFFWPIIPLVFIGLRIAGVNRARRWRTGP